MSFDAARLFGEHARGVYKELGYSIVEVPQVPVRDRVVFVSTKIQQIAKGDGWNQARE